MNDRMDFEIVCPNDHEQTVTFGRKEFEEELKSGALVFHSVILCDANWPPSHEDIAKTVKSWRRVSVAWTDREPEVRGVITEQFETRNRSHSG